MVKSAKFSDDRKYRYYLIRVWDERKPVVMVIGLNPSTANENSNDNTISNLINVLTTLGWGGFYMTNLFGYISSNPDDLRTCPDPVGLNDEWLRDISKECSQVVFAWGNFKQAEYRAKIVKKMFPDALCFGKNKNGSPWHPRAMVYIKGALASPKLIKF